MQIVGVWQQGQFDHAMQVVHVFDQQQHPSQQYWVAGLNTGLPSPLGVDDVVGWCMCVWVMLCVCG